MKRRLAALVLCLMLLGTAAAQEDIAVPESLAPKAIPGTAELRSDVDIAGAMRDSLRSKDAGSGNVHGLNTPPTSDRVSVGADGTLTVQTDRLSLSVLPPFGTMAFSQDAQAQADVYSMFDDPGAIVSLLQELGAHICIVDLSYGTEIFASTSEDTVSSIVADIDAVADSALESLLDPLRQANPGADVSLASCGDHSFLVYDYRKTGDQMIIYTSVKANTNIDFVMLPGGDEITDMEISTMESVLSGAQLSAI